MNLGGTIFSSGASLTCSDSSSECQANTVFIHGEDGHVVQCLRGQAFQQHSGLRASQYHLETKHHLVLLDQRHAQNTIYILTFFPSHTLF